MRVSVEETGDLGRRMTVDVPHERIESEVENRLKTLAREARIDGFRPGKVPVKVVRERFGARVEEEVKAEVMRSSFQEAIAQEELHPAGEPVIETGVAEGDRFRYAVTFDVYPDISIQPAENIKIVRPTVEIGEPDVDGMIETLRKQRTDWKEVGRAGATGDRTLVHFKGEVDGKEIPGNQDAGVPFILGAGEFLPGFDDGLIGASAGDKLELNLEFPADFADNSVAGKPVKFEVEVLSVSEAELPEVDAEFATSFGVTEGGLEAFRREIRNNMDRELYQAVRGRIKAQVMDALLGAHQIDVPSTLISQELQRLQQQPDHQPSGNIEQEAERRVKLGLILGEFVKVYTIQPDPDRLRQTVERLAESYENPQEVVAWYYSNREILAQVEMMVMEDQVVDWVVEHADVTDEPTSFSSMMQLATA